MSSYSNIVGGVNPTAWKPATFQPFDVSKYLRRGVGTTSYGNTAYKPWWEKQEQPTAAPRAQQQPWWHALSQDLPEDAPSTPAATSYKPAYQAYVPGRGTQPQRRTPAVSTTPAAGKTSYWWQK